MPDRLIPLLDSLFMTIMPLFIYFASFSMLTIIPIILSSLWWITKIKRDVVKFHNGSYKEWFKAIVKKN